MNQSLVFAYPIEPVLFVKKEFFPYWMVLAPLSKIIWLYMWGFIPGLLYSFSLYICPHCYCIEMQQIFVSGLWIHLLALIILWNF